jgi:antitoxin (DNA-binding transcriptional repressor) of toxin-antitoxin stability system
MNATIVDLRYRMKDVLRAIDRGETVTVLYRGKEKAKLTPIPPASAKPGKSLPRVEDSPFFGMWADREDMADPVAWVRKIREPRTFPMPKGPKREAPKHKGQKNVGKTRKAK